MTGGSETAGPDMAAVPAWRAAALRGVLQAAWIRLGGRDRASHEAYLEQGWMHQADPREPVRGERTPPEAACGIYRRPGYRIPGKPDEAPALCEWVAVADGRPAFRWAGPQLAWSHPLISPWNPILAQHLTFDRLLGHNVWPDSHAWNREAIAAGWKPAGYFRDGAGAEACAEDAGIEVRRNRAGLLSVSARAARRGTLADVYGRPAILELVGEYRRVLARYGDPSGLVADEVDPILEHLEVPLPQLLDEIDSTPLAVTGLTLGYPPEATAGYLLHKFAHSAPWWGRCGLRYAEVGALCGPDAARIDDLPNSLRRRG